MADLNPERQTDMADLIRALVLRTRLRFGPRTGGVDHASPAAPAPHPVPAPPGLRWPPAPYGDETALIRPYVRAHDAADFGIDLDTHLVGARGVA